MPIHEVNFCLPSNCTVDTVYFADAKRAEKGMLNGISTYHLKYRYIIRSLEMKF